MHFKLILWCVAPWCWLRLRALWSLVDQGNVERKGGGAGLGFFLFLCSLSHDCFSPFRHNCLLRVDADPPAACVLEYMRENALLIEWIASQLPMHHIGAVHNGYVIDGPDAHYLL